LLGLIILALLLYFLVFRNNNDQTAIGAVMTDTSRTAAGDTVQGRPLAVYDSVPDYIAYVNNDHSMGKNHDYSSEALTMLAEAIRYKANRVNVDLSADLDQAKQLAGEITNDPSATSHASSIHRAAQILTGAMQRLQGAKYPNLNSEMQAVKQAANSINPSTEVLNQKHAVKGFFDKAATLLQEM
jgi:hypothetical protein